MAIPAPFHELDQMPWSDAVVRESLRVSTNPNVNERTINSHGALICDTYLPPGTAVSASDVLVARDPSIFGEKADKFVPQRWLDADEDKIKEMKRSSMCFSFGRRECMGRHLAMIELKKCVAMLVAAFKMELVEGPERGFPCGVGYCNFKVRLQPRS